MRILLVMALAGWGMAAMARTVVLRDWEFRKDGDTAWRKVAVPHDWAIEETPVRDLCPHQGDLPFVGKGRYRRAFDGFAPEAGGRVYLDFDGIMCRSEIFLNGEKVGGTPFGYTSEVIDVTDRLKASGNVLEVTAENVPRSSRWYPGSGMFREATARIVPRAHVKPRTLFIRTLDADERRATVAVSFEWAGGASNYTFTVEQPRLWSPETPHLYELELFGERFRYGIRKAEFIPGRGFFLNGRHRQMRGVCMHHDLGPIGARFDRVFARRQLTILKEMGCDAIRTSHNPPAAALLDLCDEVGVLVMDEAFDMWEKSKGDYSNFFKEWHERDLTELVRRDRSHPCVVMWSIGNELSEFGDPSGRDAIRIATELTAIVKRSDPTRPVTFGSWQPEPMWNGCQKTVDAFGANYLPFKYAEFTRRNPGIGLVGTETCSTVSSRGEYFFPVVASPIAQEGDLKRRRDEGRQKMVRGAQMSGYDLWGPHPNDYPPDVEFEYQERNPQVYGEFVWTGFDYIGEPDPCAGAGGRLSYFGIFDLCGLPKDRYWLYKAQWRPEVPSAHILPHWNWEQMGNFTLPVHVYSSGDEAELFVNGVSQGRRKRGRHQYRFVWEKVAYAPGEVAVKTWKNGRPWAEDRVVTAGEPARVLAEEEAEHPGFFRLRVVDAKGNFCPTAKLDVELKTTGGWRVIAVGNGDASDHSPSLGATRVRTFNGLALVVVEKKGAEGTLSVAAAGCGAFHMRSIAHRGLHGPGIAQNSVEGFKAAWAAGAKWIETDFHLIKGGRLLCVHDRTELQRISGEDRVVADLTPEDVASIDIGKLAKTAKPVHMPYVEEVLATVPKDCIAQCEIKLYGKTYADTFDAARRAAGLSETNILVTSFNAKWLGDFKRRYPKYQTGWLGAGIGGRKAAAVVDVPGIVKTARSAGVDIVCPGAASAMKAGLTPADADAIRAAGFDFRLYGVNNPKALAYALSVKATAFTCDHWLDSFKWAKELPGLRLTP